MARVRLDYDQLAEQYDARYAVRRLTGIATALRHLITRLQARRVLEVGCGTGHWLEELGSSGDLICGVDPSFRMLHHAAGRARSAALLAARANTLPFRPSSFDLIFCVNAIHHFDDPEAFVAHARDRLVQSGALAVVGIDPRLIHSWYLYEYFEGSYQRDLERYPSVGDIVNWMAAAGFSVVEYRVVELSSISLPGRSVLADPFLKKESNSLLALLSDDEYAAGLRRIEAALERAEREGRNVVFASELPFVMITGAQTESVFPTDR